MVSEVMTVLMFEEFHSQQDSSQCELDMQIETMESKMQLALDVDHTELREIWEESKILHADLKNSFTEWKEAACNENVRYWSLFLDELYPILRDLTQYTLNSTRRLASFHFSCAEVHAFVLRIWPD